MAFISDSLAEAIKSVVAPIEESFFDEEGNEVSLKEARGYLQMHNQVIKIGDKDHPRNRIPMEHYDDFKKEYPGAKVFFRGPRNSQPDRHGRSNRTMKKDATHFYAYNITSNGPRKSKVAESVDEFDGLSEEQLVQMAESFEDKLEKIRAKIAKKPKDDYDFEPEKPKAAKTTVTGTYGKSYTDMDDEGKEKVTKAAETQVKRGRGRPRGSKNK